LIIITANTTENSRMALNMEIILFLGDISVISIMILLLCFSLVPGTLLTELLLLKVTVWPGIIPQTINKLKAPHYYLGID